MESAPNLFDFNDYRSFLEECVGVTGTRTGVRLALAKAIGCHSSYLTKVLDGSANFSLEQALGAGKFLGLLPAELEYFLLLVQHARAGNPDLCAYFLAKIEESRRASLQLKKRITIRESLSREQQTIYYSSWRYAAVHMALTVPSLRSRAALSQYFKLSPESIATILEFLLSVGLARVEGGVYYAGSTQLHLAGDSPNIYRHHLNWQTQALLSVERVRAQDLHYGGVMTLSRKNAETVRERLVQTLKETLASIAAGTDEEQVYALTLNWFVMGGE